MTQRSAAFATAGLIMLVPANLLPVMYSDAVRQTAIEATILSGIIRLYEDGLWPLAAIVFIASLLVPLLKILGIAWLLYASRRSDPQRALRGTRLYRLLETIGRWSMLDVFLVAFLTGAVRFGRLAGVEPRAGIIAFAAAVVLTMLATRSFEPRYLWDQEELVSNSSRA